VFLLFNDAVVRLRYVGCKELSSGSVLLLPALTKEDSARTLLLTWDVVGFLYLQLLPNIERGEQS
jgi:hypothetical protein